MCMTYVQIEMARKNKRSQFIGRIGKKTKKIKEHENNRKREEITYLQ